MSRNWLELELDERGEEYLITELQTITIGKDIEKYGGVFLTKTQQFSEHAKLSTMKPCQFYTNPSITLTDESSASPQRHIMRCRYVRTEIQQIREREMSPTKVYF